MWLQTTRALPLVAVFLSTLSAATDSRLTQPRQLTTVIHSKLTIINGTPYPFNRSNIHQAQLNNWTADTTPAIVAPGQNATFFYDITTGGDAAGDLAYKLVIDGDLSNKTFNIHVQGKDNLDGYTLSADVSGGLSTLGHGSGQRCFQFVNYGGMFGRSDIFVLSGDEKHGYSTVAPPTAWMNALGDNFKKLSMVEVVMPASHDSGMSTIVGNHFGTSVDTQTQYVDIYGQLSRGIRYLDIRPYLDNATDIYRLGHYTGSLGAYGQTLSAAIDDINRFTADYPGEFILIDLIPGFQVITPSASDFTADQYNRLLDILESSIVGVNTSYTRTNFNTDSQLAGEPLSTFYSQNPSPVFVRVRPSALAARLPAVNATTVTGIVTPALLPLDSNYSDTDDKETMRTDQLKKFQAWPSMFKHMWTASFTLTWMLTSGRSLETMAWDARDVLYESAWAWSSKEKYPNQLLMDYVPDSQAAALAVAMNFNFAFPNIPGWS